jgi:hypothetical protein
MVGEEHPIVLLDPTHPLHRTIKKLHNTTFNPISLALICLDNIDPMTNWLDKLVAKHGGRTSQLFVVGNFLINTKH